MYTPAGTLIVGLCSSERGVSARFVQSLVPFTPGGILPVQVIVTFWFAVVGTVIVLVAGSEATLTTARSAPNPNKATAARTRELKIPDLEE